MVNEFLAALKETRENKDPKCNSEDYDEANKDDDADLCGFGKSNGGHVLALGCVGADPVQALGVERANSIAIETLIVVGAPAAAEVRRADAVHAVCAAVFVTEIFDRRREIEETDKHNFF